MRGGQIVSYIPVQKTLQIRLRVGDIVVIKPTSSSSALAVEEIKIAGKRFAMSFAMSSRAETFPRGDVMAFLTNKMLEERCPYDG